jgi:site-specific DNA-adenine methylase
MLRNVSGLTVDAAVAYYFINRLAFSAAHNGGFSRDRWDQFVADRRNRINNLATWSAKMQGWQITNLDFERVLLCPWRRPDGFAFVDPPYVVEVPCLYRRHALFSHERFVGVAHEVTSRMMITYHQEAQPLFSHWSHCSTWRLGYSMRSDARYRTAQDERLELLVLNYSAPRGVGAAGAVGEVTAGGLTLGG